MVYQTNVEPKVWNEVDFFAVDNLSEALSLSELGMVVVLLGSQKGNYISADELAERIDTINYEIVSRINPSTPRVIVD